MKAVTFQGKGKVKVQEVPRPALKSSEDAIVRLTTAAICGSDLHILHGFTPFEIGASIGHEGAGIVEEVGSDVHGFKSGDRVLCMAGINCGRCPACRANMIWACQNGGIYGNGPMFGNLGGTQAEYLRVGYADETLAKIPDSLTDEQVLFAGDILATAYTGFVGVNPDGRKGIMPGKVVAIFGAGPVGLCAIACARLFGPSKIIVVDLLDNRLEKAKALGADHVINAQTQDPVAAIMEITQGRGVGFALEATGSHIAVENCVKAAGLCGTVVILGIIDKPVEFDFHNLIIKNLTIEAGISNVIHTAELLSLIENHKIDMTSIITHRFPIDDGEKAYHLFNEKLDGAIKVLFKF